MKKLASLIMALMLPASLFAATIAGTVTTGAGTAATPVAGAKVVLIAAAGGGGGGVNGRRLDSAMTNAQGQYTFNTDSTGFRLLTVTATGYANGNGFVNVANDTGSYTANVTLVATGAAAGSGSIAGTVTTGTGAGTPVAGATVILRRGGGGGGGGFGADTVKTDAQGKYAFDSVAVGTNYTLTVSATGLTTETRNNVAVAADKATTENFTMAAPIGPGSIAGKVTNAAGGAAIAGARVILTRAAGGGGGGRRPDTVMTDAQGMFAFDSVANQGNYVLTVSAAGFGTAENNNVDVSGGLKTTADFALTAAVAGDTTGTIKGVVTNASSHAAVANARVILARVGGGGGGNNGAALDTVMTDAAGSFSFTKLAAPGNYRVTVSLAGFQNAQSNTLNLAQGSTFVADFELAAAASILPGSALSGAVRSHWLDGRLVLDLAASAHVKAVAVFGADGALRHRVPVAPGALRIVLPSDVKPGAGTLLRVED